MTAGLAAEAHNVCPLDEQCDQISRAHRSRASREGAGGALTAWLQVSRSLLSNPDWSHWSHWATQPRHNSRLLQSHNVSPPPVEVGKQEGKTGSQERTMDGAHREREEEEVRETERGGERERKREGRCQMQGARRRKTHMHAYTYRVDGIYWHKGQRALCRSTAPSTNDGNSCVESNNGEYPYTERP
ncbi:unnamed protein product [Pleuronectes platessa]|uniref:Uncharacterized protein n=1 Tax=Pleuronectes platessa TaxID=8262 RepID=A0A9N7Z2S5_PLEPL|nr:unnamed protein product [Pleuronectes platessa]